MSKMMVVDAGMGRDSSKARTTQESLMIMVGRVLWIYIISVDSGTKSRANQ